MPTPPAPAAAARPLAVVTGASSGIGQALALALAREGFDLALIARTPTALTAVAQAAQAHGAAVTCIPADLATAAGVAAAIAAVEALGRPVEVLVNNAGFGLFGPFVTEDPVRETQMIQLNCVCLTTLTRRWLPGMVARGHGRVLMVASTAAFQPGPGMAVYFATKAYVLHLSEALAHEVQGSGVTVTALCPGPTASGFADAAAATASQLFRGRRLPTSEAVAAYGVRALRRGQRVAIHGWRNRLLAFSVRFAPRRLVTAMTARIQAVHA